MNLKNTLISKIAACGGKCAKMDKPPVFSVTDVLKRAACKKKAECGKSAGCGKCAEVKDAACGKNAGCGCKGGQKKCASDIQYKIAAQLAATGMHKSAAEPQNESKGVYDVGIGTFGDNFGYNIGHSALAGSYIGRLKTNARGSGLEQLGPEPPAGYSIDEKTRNYFITNIGLDRIRERQAKKVTNDVLGIGSFTKDKDNIYTRLLNSALIRMGKENYELYKKTGDVPVGPHGLWKYRQRNWTGPEKYVMDQLSPEAREKLENAANFMAQSKDNTTSAYKTASYKSSDIMRHMDAIGMHKSAGEVESTAANIGTQGDNFYPSNGRSYIQRQIATANKLGVPAPDIKSYASSIRDAWFPKKKINKQVTQNDLDAIRRKQAEAVAAAAWNPGTPAFNTMVEEYIRMGRENQDYNINTGATPEPESRRSWSPKALEIFRALPSGDDKTRLINAANAIASR